MSKERLIISWNEELLREAGISQKSVEKFLSVLKKGLINSFNELKKFKIDEIALYAEIDKKECAIIFIRDKKLRIYLVLGHEFDEKKIICEIELKP